jgi:hypothetical protein
VTTDTKHRRERWGLVSGATHGIGRAIAAPGRSSGRGRVRFLAADGHVDDIEL